MVFQVELQMYNETYKPSTYANTYSDIVLW